jgi:hypothetical protein
MMEDAGMSFPRIVQNETLDHLPENDPRAIRSRLDLQRINRVMGAKYIMLYAVRQARLPSPPRRILELGTGDGTLMLALARSLAPRWCNVQIGLLDRQNLVTPHTLQELRKLGWQPQVITQDVLEWSEQDGGGWDLILANLFIHHFEGEALTRLLHAVSARSRAFIACEPRRSRFALTGSRLVRLLGANDVTQEDAVLSVQAGFRLRELSSLWPHNGHCWNLHECEAGPFSHCFIAARAELH